MSSREKTNSITHLVKIVAGEVLEEDALICDLKQAIKWIAARRGRTTGAIDARLAQLVRSHRVL